MDTAVIWASRATVLPASQNDPTGRWGTPKSQYSIIKQMQERALFQLVFSTIFTLERPVWEGCILKAFSRYLDESCLQGIGAEMILFSMLWSILLWITPSGRACECKWIYQFLKYKLIKNACDFKNPIQAPSAAQLWFATYRRKSRIISKACSKLLKKIPIISSFTGLCMKTIPLPFSSE